MEATLENQYTIFCYFGSLWKQPAFLLHVGMSAYDVAVPPIVGETDMKILALSSFSQYPPFV